LGRSFVKFQHVDVEVGRFGAVLRDVDARERSFDEKPVTFFFLLQPMNPRSFTASDACRLGRMSYVAPRSTAKP